MTRRRMTKRRFFSLFRKQISSARALFSCRTIFNSLVPFSYALLVSLFSIASKLLDMALCLFFCWIF